MKMKTIIILVLIYAFLMALAQIFLKTGVTGMGGFKLKGTKDVFPLLLNIIKNKAILAGMFLMVSSFFLWLYILSVAKLSLVFPLTASMYIFVALLSFFILGEKLALFNYVGVALIISGTAFLLMK